MSEEQDEDLKVIHLGPPETITRDIDQLVGNRDPRIGNYLQAVVSSYLQQTCGPTVTLAEWQAFTKVVPTRLRFQTRNEEIGKVIAICRLPMRGINDPPGTPTTHWRMVAVQESQLRYYRSLVYDQPILLSGHVFDPQIVIGGIDTVIEKALSAEGCSKAVIIDVLAGAISSLLVSVLPADDASIALLRLITVDIRNVVTSHLDKVSMLKARHDTGGDPEKPA